MNILRDVTEGYHPVGGFKRVEMAIYSAGRGTGKSLYNRNPCKEIMMPSLNGMKVPQWVRDADKYKFSRKWHVVEYDWQDYDAVREWCVEQFGPHPQNPDAWSRWWHSYADSIRIRDEQDYVLFMLRWS